MRNLVRIESITDIKPIEKADAIEAAFVGGWAVVVKKGEYAVGDKAVYFEIDSFLPEGNPAWQFLIEKSSRMFGGVNGHVLRTVRLRGQLSQGLLLPLAQFGWSSAEHVMQGIAELLGVEKYEKPISAEMSGEACGPFPSMVPKTDQDRVQNLSAEISSWAEEGLEWEVTEKMEGSSCTVSWDDDVMQVCSRNINLRENEGNTFWGVVRTLDIQKKLEDNFMGRKLALQGELVGPGIEGNIYQFRKHNLYIYDVYDIQAGQYLGAHQRHLVVSALGLPHIPVLDRIKLPKIGTMEALLLMAEGVSQFFDTQREGLVFKAFLGDKSFKVISNKYLIKQK